jgi:2-keto-3-deoxy-L-rhamnonate aldolase RhmA
VPLGAYVGTADAARAEISAGTRMVAVGADTAHLLSAANHVLAESART